MVSGGGTAYGVLGADLDDLGRLALDRRDLDRRDLDRRAGEPAEDGGAAPVEPTTVAQVEEDPAPARRSRGSRPSAGSRRPGWST